jgi:uncharacterized protein (TIGR00369 family)
MGRNAELLQRWAEGTLTAEETGGMQLPPTIVKAIPFRITGVTPGSTIVEIDTDLQMQANPMGTIHGGVLCTIADAAIGMAHWSGLEAGESFTSVDFKINFFRPVWGETLRAVARVIHAGRSVSYYECPITRSDGKLVAHATSTVMTLRGEAAAGR